MVYKEGIVAAITALKDRNGSSMIAIKKHMKENLPKDKKWVNGMFLKALKAGVASGEFVQVKSSYKLSPEFKKKAAKKDAPKKKAPAKKTSAKKKTATKKTATKKTATKKSATKKTAAKKTTTAKSVSIYLVSCLFGIAHLASLSRHSHGSLNSRFPSN